MSGKDLGHAFACDVLELNCHENGTVVGLESEIYSPRVINAPSLVKSVHENSFRDRDCGFQVSLEESRHFLNILYGPGLFGHCDTEPSSQEVYRKFAESPALVLDDIRWKSNCPASSLIDSDVRTTTDPAEVSTKYDIKLPRLCATPSHRPRLAAPSPALSLYQHQS